MKETAKPVTREVLVALLVDAMKAAMPHSVFAFAFLSTIGIYREPVQVRSATWKVFWTLLTNRFGDIESRHSRHHSPVRRDTPSDMRDHIPRIPVVSSCGVEPRGHSAVSWGVLRLHSIQPSNPLKPLPLPPPRTQKRS